jgi:hypothetical protein
MKKNTLLFLGVLPIISFYQQTTAMQMEEGLLPAKVYTHRAAGFFKKVFGIKKLTQEQSTELCEFFNNRIKNATQILQHQISDIKEEIREKKILNPKWILLWTVNPENNLNIQAIYYFAEMIRDHLVLGLKRKLGMKTTDFICDYEKEYADSLKKVSHEEFQEQVDKLDLDQLGFIESKIFAQALLNHMKIMQKPLDEQKS